MIQKKIATIEEKEWNDIENSSIRYTNDEIEAMLADGNSTEIVLSEAHIQKLLAMESIRTIRAIVF